MQPCVIYARVSTKEQQAEGYSIPAQLKAIRAFCEAQGLSPVAEFVEAESAGKAGRKQFGEMVGYLAAHRDVRQVVAHKQDRLFRNFRDPITLQDLGVRPRYVMGDLPNTPQGELLSDVTLSVSKFYLGNLSEEVKKGMDEKVAQGGWPHKAPTGYLNDKNTRSLILDPERAPHIVYAFERYASRQVSLKVLAEDLYARGLRTISGNRMGPSALHKLLQNPMYTGVVRHKGRIVPGTHPAIITPELFDAAQEAFHPVPNKVIAAKHVFALRDYLVCAECGCKITAENQKEHRYYRCTHGKGRDACSQRKYAREEALFAQVEEILSSIEIDTEIVESLIADSRLLDEQERSGGSEEVTRLSRELSALDTKASRLLDGYLEGVVPADAYRTKVEEIATERRAIERRLERLSEFPDAKTPQVEALARTAMNARTEFVAASVEGKRKVLNTVLLNASLEGGNIVSYQLKRPFECLQRDPKGAFRIQWWAIEDLNL